MMRRAIRMLALLVPFALAGCGGVRGLLDREYVGNGVRSEGGATIVTAEELHETHGSVLRAIEGKVAGMKVDFTGLDRCPAITMRRSKEIHGQNFPDVYVDGTRASNTCILESLQSNDVERVEVYPMGFTTRPGYGNSTHGLILVFMRKI